MQPAHPLNGSPWPATIKRYGYLLVLVPPCLPFIAYLISRETGGDNFWAFFSLIVYYVAIPALDFTLGQDSSNADLIQTTPAHHQRFYHFVLRAAVLVGALSFIGGIVLFTTWEELNLIGKFGLILSFGTVHANMMINTAHELIHRTNPTDQRLGGLLLTLVCYPSFKIEHIRGHHIHVATPLDNSTASLNQSLYHFLPRAILNNIQTAWRLENERLTKRGKRIWSKDNELIRWYSLCVLCGASIVVIFSFPGLVFFILQSLVAICVLESVNYLEHYGLQRRVLDSGRYERTSILHSWNSNYWLSNLLTFQLQRHADHHASPQRPYYALRHFNESPQLPAGYSTMILVTLIPSLWKNIMNPKVERYYQKREVAWEEARA